MCHICAADTLTAISRAVSPASIQAFACFAQDPKAEIADQLRALCDRYEIGGRNVAEGGVGPTHQRLKPGDTTGRKFDLRLIVHRKTGVVVDRAAQFAGQHHLVLRASAHVGFEDIEAAAPVFLRAVER